MNDAIPKDAVPLYQKNGYTIYKFNGMYFLRGLTMNTTHCFVNNKEFKEFVTAMFSAYVIDRSMRSHKGVEIEQIE